MFLKHYEGLSDAKIIENLNLNIAYQLFSGVVLAEGECCIKDLTLLSSWRTKFGIHMDANFFQGILQHHWKGHISDTSSQWMLSVWNIILLTRPVSNYRGRRWSGYILVSR
jgi:hypothetical protein